MIVADAIVCLALNIYHESRNQSEQGQIAVAQVTMNRAHHNPMEVCGVVFKPYQFSWANPLTTVDKKTRLKNAKKLYPTDEVAWEKALRIARKALYGKLTDVVGPATHYFNPMKAHPKWQHAMVNMGKVGDHKFYLDWEAL